MDWADSGERKQAGGGEVDEGETRGGDEEGGEVI
jgi:hypothetical protein